VTTTYGYKTKRGLPARPGNAKVCTRCDRWFLAAPFERVCFGCLRPAERTLRALKRPAEVITPATPKRRENAQVNGTRSEALGVTFKPGVPLSKVLAVEAAAWLDADPKARPTRPPWDAR
jgi:hypothetical protein